MSVGRAVHLCTAEIAGYLGIDGGLVHEGRPADIAIIDPQALRRGTVEDVHEAPMQGLDGLMRYVRRKGKRHVRFSIHPFQRDTHSTIETVAAVVEERHVRSSNGKSELRPVIRTPIELGGQRWTIEITLTNRDEMGFRMLLGRNALRGRFLVDPSHSYVQDEHRGEHPHQPRGAHR